MMNQSLKREKQHEYDQHTEGFLHYLKQISSDKKTDPETQPAPEAPPAHEAQPAAEAQSAAEEPNEDDKNVHKIIFKESEE